LGKSYWFCPRGPIINYQLSITNYDAIIDFLIRELLKAAKEDNIIFLRFEPQKSIVKSQLSIVRSIDIEPSKTLILNLEKSEEEILKSMHQKTRYNIRLAEKKEIKIEIMPPNTPLTPSPHPDSLLRKEKGETRGGGDDFESWWGIMEQTKDRDGFRLHGKEYYRSMVSGVILNGAERSEESRDSSPRGFGTQNDKSLSIKLIVAKYNNKVIAGNIVSFFGDMVTYVHGASSNEYRNLMAPYLLQWETIKMAKSLGYKYYDFFGIDEQKWPGVTRFKKGFSDNEINYPGTFDIVFDSKWYWAYNLIRKMRRRLNI
jgi:lipid II:glycine glycyltransferase (peptidoglycan interpeptide bridge formation enzyme)